MHYIMEAESRCHGIILIEFHFDTIFLTKEGKITSEIQATLTTRSVALFRLTYDY